VDHTGPLNSRSFVELSPHAGPQVVALIARYSLIELQVNRTRDYYSLLVPVLVSQQFAFFEMKSSYEKRGAGSVQ
jgi:hypothetical protein